MLSVGNSNRFTKMLLAIGISNGKKQISVSGRESVWMRGKGEDSISQSDAVVQSISSPIDAARSPFAIERMLPPQSGLKGVLLGCAAPVINSILGLRKLDQMYNRIQQAGAPFASPDEFLKVALQQMNISYDLAVGSLDRIPKTGPLVVVANHPFGGIEACILLRILTSIRQDIRFMANFLLGKLQETKDFCIFVDPFGGDRASRRNLQPLRESIDWVQQGGVLCVFPSGTVSHFHWPQREITDPPWSPSVSRVVRRSGAPVIPVFFPGSNGLFFQGMGLIHPILRTALLARELGNKCNKTFEVRIGNLVPFAKLTRFHTDEELITYLRLRTYILGNRNRVELSASLSPSARSLNPIKHEKILPPAPSQLLQDEVDKLPASQILLQSDGMIVAFSRAAQTPNILREIGRLREITFREVNEGTGKAIDLDEFDRYYLHLFIWNNNKQEVVGAYRLGRTDRILRHFGSKGLYSSTLFDFDEKLLKQLGPSLELGRSFVRLEYQKTYTALLLLWRGICHFVLKTPRYTRLFGPVSINNEYDSVSRELITMFLKANNIVPELAKLIRARNPMSRTKIKGMDIHTTSFVVKDLRDVSDLLQDIESTQKSVPVLLKQYLKLGGKLLGFNVDSSFGDVLDGLICVDLLETDPRFLERYMTNRENVVQFYAAHGKTLPEIASLEPLETDSGSDQTATLLEPTAAEIDSKLK